MWLNVGDDRVRAKDIAVKLPAFRALRFIALFVEPFARVNDGFDYSFSLYSTVR
jgi:hypothetical protein